jgi:peptide-methionine (S)-S-oxide reductase
VVCEAIERGKKIVKGTFAAGCFWGVQYYFDQIPGVRSSRVGYTGGHTENPSYEDVCTHMTGHAEAVELEFDESQVSYETLVMQFFRMHDPTQLNRQGPDVGDSYRSAIFYHSDQQKTVAEKVMAESRSNFNEPIVTQVVPATTFYEAEDYHQKFAERTGRGMCHVQYEPVKE